MKQEYLKDFFNLADILPIIKEYIRGLPIDILLRLTYYTKALSEKAVRIFYVSGLASLKGGQMFTRFARKGGRTQGVLWIHDGFVDVWNIHRQPDQIDSSDNQRQKKITDPFSRGRVGYLTSVI